MHEIKSCGVFVIRHHPVRSFLLMVHPTRYDLPKGHVDPGETELQCALRELEEETSISQADIDIDPDFRFSTRYNVQSRKRGGETCRKTLVIYLGHLKRDVQIQLSEHTGYEWRQWNPPHRIQVQTIDPVVHEVQQHLGRYP